MLVQRLRRWPNIRAALGQCLVFAGLVLTMSSVTLAIRIMSKIENLTFSGWPADVQVLFQTEF